MANTTTMLTLFRRAIRELDVGWVAVVADGTTALTALAATTLTIPSLFDDDSYSTGSLRSLRAQAWRLGAASVADYERPLGDLARDTGVITIAGGANYSDTTVGTEIPYIMKWAPRVADWVDALNRVMEDTFVTTNFFLSHATHLDSGMLLATDTNFTDIGTLTTSAKSTDERRTPYGPYSYELLNNAVADSGTRTATLGVTLGKRAKAFTIGSTNAGTSSIRFRDVTGSTTADGAAVTSSEEDPQLMMLDWQVIDAAARELALDLTNTSATGHSFWNQYAIYLEDNLVLRLPPEVTQHYQVPSIFQLRPTGGQTSDGVWPAQSMELVQLVEDEDYRLQFNQYDGKPSAVYFDSASWFDYPIMVQAKVPASLFTVFTSTESTTTRVELAELMPKFKRELLDSVYLGRMPADQWAIFSSQVGNLGSTEIMRSQAARVTKPIAKAKPYFAGARRL